MAHQLREAQVFRGREIQEAGLQVLLIPIRPVVVVVLAQPVDREAKEDQDPLASFRDQQPYTPVGVAVNR